MASKTQKGAADLEVDRYSDEVDPRVQIELERLNTATDDINKLEVDLDEARAAFRHLLCESTVRIDSLAKKLGSCVEKARPYYEARMKAKEALHETQQAAVKFERANSAHAAAKEMVYLAEEGLSTEGRTFDHAWQEMLNHATMRVNESERERTISEAEHRRTSQMYHRAEMRVQQLQKDLKRAIAKSSLNARRSLLQINNLAYQHQLQLLPYFEMKAQFNQALEEQKKRVKSLEQQVCHSKMSYAEALRNLEQISDEIHRTRKCKASGDPLDVRRPGVGADSPQPQANSSADLISDGNDTEGPPPRSSSSQTDTDMWSDSTGTGPPDSDSEEYLRLPDRLGPNASPFPEKVKSESVTSQMSEYLSLSGLSNGRGGLEETERGAQLAELAARPDALNCSNISPKHGVGDTVMETSFMDAHSSSITPQGDEWDQSLDSPLLPRDSSADQIWTEIKLVETPDEISQTFAKMGSNAHKKVDRDYIQYSPIADDSSRSQCSDKTDGTSFSSVIKKPFLPIASFPEKSFLPQSPLLKSRKAESVSDQSPLKSSQSLEDNKEKEVKAVKPGGIALFRTASIDRPSQGSLPGWISRSSASEEFSNTSPRRQSLDALFGGPTTEKVKELLSHGMMMLNISSLTDKKPTESKEILIENVPDTGSEERKCNFLPTKKVPSPLEKSLMYLNAEEDSTSDSESLASVEMLSDEQISSLMLEQDIQDACEEVLGTPISEISPLIQDLRNRDMRLLQENEQES